MNRKQSVITLADRRFVDRRDSLYLMAAGEIVDGFGSGNRIASEQPAEGQEAGHADAQKGHRGRLGDGL